MRNTLLETKLGVIFEEFGFKYIGPLDGHNISVVMAALKYAKSYNGPIMLHLITKKGKGLKEAEADPVKFHGTSPKSSQEKKVTPPPNFSAIFGDEVCQIAKTNPLISVITHSGFVRFEQEFPDRYYDVGIAEEHAVTFAAGQARVGLKPISHLLHFSTTWF